MIRAFTPEVARQICELLGLDVNSTQSLVLTSEGAFVTLLRRNASGHVFVEPFTDEFARDYAFLPLGGPE